MLVLTYMHRVWRSTIVLSVASCYIMWGKSSHTHIWWGLNGIGTDMDHSNYISGPVASLNRAENDRVEAWV